MYLFLKVSAEDNSCRKGNVKCLGGLVLFIYLFCLSYPQNKLAVVDTY